MPRQKGLARKVDATTYDIHDSATVLPPRLLVDTNVWLLWHYSPASLGHRQAHAVVYNDFLARCLDEGCQLIRSPFTLPEITHVIEKAECDAADERGERRTMKQRRWEPNHRLKVIAEVKTTWDQVVNISEWSPGITVNGAAGDQMFVDWRNFKIDGYDLLLIQEALEGEGLPILTDDFDYLSVPRLTVFTGNPSAVNAARAVGKLRV